MFDLPQAKRVRRSDLYSSLPPSPSRSDANSVASASESDEEGQGGGVEDGELQAKLHAHFASLYGPVTTSTNPATSSGVNKHVSVVEGTSRGEEMEIGKGLLEKEKGIAHGDEDGSDSEDALSSSSPDGENDVGIERTQPTTQPPQPPTTEQAYEFRLFSSSTNHTSQSTSATPKIILLDPSDTDAIISNGQAQQSSGFIPLPDPRIFTVEKATGTKLEDIRSIAVSGDTVMEESKRRNWGLEVKWRVTVVRGNIAKQKTTQKIPAPFRDQSDSENDNSEPNKDKTKKPKPNKKRRIILRTRAKKVEGEKERRKREEALKEENEREKKTRRNREKKIKRKLKLKAVAVAGKVGGVDDSAAGIAQEKELEGEKMEID